jgi:hypothetical protein
MKLTILTAEESLEYWNKEKEERRKWTIDEIVNDAKFMTGMPDMGNTKYIIGEENWNNFFEWLKTEEAIKLWNEDPFTLSLAKYYSENKQK